MAKQLEDKVALMTGESSGIGRATALAFAREEAKVVVADPSVSGGEQTVHLIKQVSGESIFVETDVSKSTSGQQDSRKLWALRLHLQQRWGRQRG